MGSLIYDYVYIYDIFFFFKQKTAYEMRISDWSSDVCSSDLNQVAINDLFPGNDEKMGQYNITIAKFYRVSGGSTQNKGVIPDIMFPSAFPPEEFGESSQPTALPWDRIDPADFQAAGTFNAVTAQLQK